MFYFLYNIHWNRLANANACSGSMEIKYKNSKYSSQKFEESHSHTIRQYSVASHRCIKTGTLPGPLKTESCYDYLPWRRVMTKLASSKLSGFSVRSFCGHSHCQHGTQSLSVYKIVFFLRIFALIWSRYFAADKSINKTPVSNWAFNIVKSISYVSKQWSCQYHITKPTVNHVNMVQPNL